MIALPEVSPARTFASLSPKRRLAIACWIDDQFDLERPLALTHPPRDLFDAPNWKADPYSGVTGTIFLYRGRVLYRASTAHGYVFWDVGRLPKEL